MYDTLNKYIDPWSGESKTKCTLTNAALSLDKLFMEYPLICPIYTSEIRCGFYSCFFKNIGKI